MGVKNMRNIKGRSIGVVLFVIAAAAAAYCVHGISEGNDPDASYHMAHARFYLERGIMHSEIPWLTASVVGEWGADIWYGFHLLIIPFVYLRPPELGIEMAGVFLLSTFLVVFYWVLLRSRLAMPYLWPFVSIVSGSSEMVRMITTRPHVVSSALSLLLFSFLLEGSAAAVFLVSMLLAFVHLSYFWMTLPVAAAVIAGKTMARERIDLRKFAVIPAGLAAGWLLRPNPVGAARITQVQTGTWLHCRLERLPDFGGEVYPVRPVDFIGDFAPLLIVWLFLIGLVIFRRRTLNLKGDSLLFGSLALSVFFVLVTVFVSLRGMDHWAPFACIFVASVITCLMKSGAWERCRMTVSGIAAAAACCVLFACLIVHAVAEGSKLMDRYGMKADRFKGAAEWLGTHSRPGDIVFHTEWQDSAPLFFWNPGNRYIGGMDPVFQYAYSPTLFWKAYHLSAGDGAAVTWGTRGLDGAVREDTFTVLKYDFGASYLIVPSGYWRKLSAYVSSDPRYTLRYRDGEASVYELTGAR